MKIAATGYVSEQAGSVASANALLLRALLDAGHEVDFFSKPSFVDPRPSAGERVGFRFICTDNVRADRFRARVQQVPLLGFLACRWDCASYLSLLLRSIRREHRDRRYDLCLWLGDYVPGRVKGLPMISFAQGPPGTDARSIVARFVEIRKLAGLGTALKWLLLAKLRLSSLGLPSFRHSDHIIVGSEQSRQTLHDSYGVPPDRTSSMPYPIDLDLFRLPASDTSADESPLRVLWLGRIIPRKRLDLFLDGLQVAIRRGLSVKATIVGGTGFVPGYEKLIEAFPFPDRLRWIKSVPRAEVPGLLHQHDVLAQPSDEENFGSSAAEAQACGLPVIVGRTNGNADHLCSRDIHLADDRPETFADALASMAKSKASNTSESRALSRALAVERFDLGHVTAQLADILGRVAKPQPPEPSAMTSIDIIIPTLKRPDDLRRCLEALNQQGIPATQIIVGVRADDDLTPEVIQKFAASMPVRAVEARGVGVVGSMNSCLAECRSEWIVLLDDDVEIPAHWLSAMIAQVRSREGIVAAGGRDMLMDYPEMRRTEPLVDDVGNVHWFGRVTGGHHRGGGNARPVQVLRGSNCLFKGDFLRACGFERGLRGRGAQVNWELALGLQAKAQHLRMIFDPSVQVIHNVAPRHDGDTVHRGIFNFEGTSDIAYNETFVALKHGRGLVRWTIPLWQLCVGSHVCPGLARAADFILRPKSMPGQRFAATWAGRRAAFVKCLGRDTGTNHVPVDQSTVTAR